MYIIYNSTLQKTSQWTNLAKTGSLKMNNNQRNVLHLTDRYEQLVNITAVW